MLETLFAFSMTNIKGSVENLSNYQGKVVLVVNVASKCGFTYQYKGLEELYQKYKDKGFVILGFPANNFMGQEPGNNEEIAEFCSLNYGVTFPMFAKISVKGKDMDPLYAWLTDKKKNPATGGDVSWNFNKFLIGRDGKVIARFDSGEKPESPKIASAIEKALK